MRAPVPALGQRQAKLHWWEGRLETGWRPHSDQDRAATQWAGELTGMPAHPCGPIFPSLSIPLAECQCVFFSLYRQQLGTAEPPPVCKAEREDHVC